MKAIDSNLQCPSCHEPLKPKVLACDDCNVRLEGPFQLNEFATLSEEDLHFLRIFVRSEGRIKDMESSLGLSYPTIRARLSELKTRVLGDEGEKAESGKATSTAPDAAEVLSQLQAGGISFADALTQIRKRRK